MLSYALAIAVAISSLVLFSTAFLMSDIHRKDDFLWSAVGLFYALVLWFCARNITGAVLLGQASASILLVSYSWQTLKLRKALANPDRAQEIDNFSLLNKINGLLSRKKSQSPVNTTPAVTTPNPKVTESEIAIPDTASPGNPTAVSPQTEASQADSDLSTQKPKVIVEDPQPNNSSAELEKTTTPPIPTPKIQIGTPTKDLSSTINQPTDRTIIPTETSTPVTETIKPEVPETIAPVNEPKTVEDPVVEDLTPKAAETKIASLPQPETAISKVESQPTTPSIKEDTQKTALSDDSVTPSEPPPESMAQDSQPIEETPPVKPKTTDALDSLETVEVAEILEAIPEDISNRKDRDRTNIIEVRTTEIDIIYQEKEAEQNSD